ncbi:heparinase II/III family protein [Rheinheimera baltica]|uniref:Heparinase II/III family protein n=1 Tax=Rheinheimera baltica TaxID=67576 RepID=A0ABT9I431_9GAMM|nr:heparinase II/III family protein [Rheinheimera baltica]MDP5138133.1 heparinase II/III family protein [Rheinheimera baltica]
MTENLNLAQLAQQLSPQALALTAANAGKNKAEYEKLKQAVYSAQINLNNFAPSQIDLRSFAWQLEGKDRNWWWQLQALPFLNWYVSSYQLQSAEEQQSFLQFCLSAFECWCLYAEHNANSPLNWHDHATAFRLRNLVNWFTHCVYNQLDNGFASDKRLQSFTVLLNKHLCWLAEDTNYSEHTNHGFDQALVMYTVALSLPNAGMEQFLQLGKSRLIAELKHAFTDEGVHKENSPGYQKFMLGRVKTLVNLDSLGDIEVSSLAKDYVEKAEAFLKALTLPNGELPMIGDTQAGNTGILDRNDSGSLEVFDYSDSGYVVIKGFTKENKAYYFLIKNGHLSNYHRHDDDLMLYLWFDGEVILGDGGLYSHNEKCELRKFFRSHFAHNLPFIQAKAVRDKSKLSSSSKLSIDSENNLIKASSYMFGVNITREVDYSNVQNGILKVIDSADNLNLNTNHFIGPGYKPVQLDVNKFKFESDRNYCSIEYEEALGLQVVNGIGQKTECISIYSNRYNEKISTFRVMFSHESEARARIVFGAL